MADNVNERFAVDFARAFGDGLNRFLEGQGIPKVEAAKMLGISKARLNTYCHDSADGKRPKPDGEVVLLACTRLQGFYFDYNGQRISAALFMKPTSHGRKPEEQMVFQFGRQFNLTDDAGTVTVKVKRPQGRIEVAVSLRAATPETT